jgi:glycosyltransferase involved in cell wall biosynthesis
MALNSIVKQTLPQSEFELIVVDNGSTDKTEKVVKSFYSKIKNLQYFYAQKPGLHVGRHLGLKKSNSNILVYTDDDIEAFPGWLEAIKNSFKDKKIYLVGGKNLPKFEARPPSWLKEIWLKKGKYGRTFTYLSISDLGNQTKEIDPLYIWGCNFSIRKSVLLECKGFHPDGMATDLIKYRGDGETYVSRFILNKRYKALYNPKASIFHLISKEKMTLDYLCRKAYLAGVSASYIKIRSCGDNFLASCQSSSEKAKNVKYGWLDRISLTENYLKRLSYKIKKFISKKRGRKNESQIVQEKMEKSFQQGFNYHQKEIRKDKNLLKWVLKNNYLN